MVKRTNSTAVNTVDEFFDNLNAYFESGDGLSVAEVANAVGVTRQHLYEIKKRASMPSFELVVKLTEVIGGKVEFAFPKNVCHV